MRDVEVVLANNDRVTLRVGDTFLKIDADQTRTDAEVDAIELAPVPTPKILWRRSPLLALASLPGRPLGRLGERSDASSAAWTSVGSALRELHDAPLPPRPGISVDDINGILPRATITRARQLAEAVLRPWTPSFIHGDLHVEHVFVDGDQVIGIIDWSEANKGDALYDIATLTLANEEHLDEVIAGYDREVDRDLIRAWWSWRCLVAIRWLSENGYGPPESYPEVAALQSLT